MSGAGVESAVEQIRMDQELARRVVDDGAPALAGFDLTDDEASALVEALRLDVGNAFDEVSGFGIMPTGLPLTTLIGVGRQLGVQDLSAAARTGRAGASARKAGSSVPAWAAWRPDRGRGAAADPRLEADPFPEWWPRRALDGAFELVGHDPDAVVLPAPTSSWQRSDFEDSDRARPPGAGADRVYCRFDSWDDPARAWRGEPGFRRPGAPVLRGAATLVAGPQLPVVGGPRASSRCHIRR